MQLFGDLFVAPVAAQAIVPVINLPGFESVDLILSRDVLADIFMGASFCVRSVCSQSCLLHAGNITNWKHPRIQALNTALVLPSAAIVVGVRSGVNGINAAFSQGSLQSSALPHCPLVVRVRSRQL